MRGRDLGRAAAVVAVVSVVAGCNTTVQEQLGLAKRSPDEFQVVRRAPLIIPPNATLRAPQPGTATASRQDPTVEARDILTGEGRGARSPTAADVPSSGAERALLAASPVRAEGDIRSRITSEDLELAQLDRRTFFYILNFQKKQFEPQNQVLNPQAEAARLKVQAQPGSVVTVHTASTPVAVP